MKLTPNEKNLVAKTLIMKMIGEKKLTDREAHIYELMRSHAFFSETKNKRGPCKINASIIADKMGVRREKVAAKLRKLQELGLVSPMYYVKVGKGTEMFTDLKFIDKKLGRINIKFTEYVIKNLPGEIEARKEFKKKKQLKHTQKT